MLGAGAAAFMFLIGAIQCWRVIMPVSFWLPGCEPENWETDVIAGKKGHDCLHERLQRDFAGDAMNLGLAQCSAVPHLIDKKLSRGLRSRLSSEDPFCETDHTHASGPLRAE
jgi:hypothetical protein